MRRYSSRRTSLVWSPECPYPIVPMLRKSADLGDVTGKGSIPFFPLCKLFCFSTTSYRAPGRVNCLSEIPVILPANGVRLQRHLDAMCPASVWTLTRNTTTALNQSCPSNHSNEEKKEKTTFLDTIIEIGLMGKTNVKTFDCRSKGSWKAAFEEGKIGRDQKFDGASSRFIFNFNGYSLPPKIGLIILFCRVATFISVNAR
jgi:hypothetical protein